MGMYYKPEDLDKIWLQGQPGMIIPTTKGEEGNFDFLSVSEEGTVQKVVVDAPPAWFVEKGAVSMRDEEIKPGMAEAFVKIKAVFS